MTRVYRIWNGCEREYDVLVSVDGIENMVCGISSLLLDLGKAGYCIKSENKGLIGKVKAGIVSVAENAGLMIN